MKKPVPGNLLKNSIKKVMINKVFVQIASYRDPQLPITIQDALETADHPENLNFGICWQKDENESLGSLENLDNIRLKKFHYTESQGLGWARKQIEDLYDEEPFTLQLDSHHRFRKGWDTMLFEDFEKALSYSKKPIITTYLTPFEVKEADKCKCNLEERPCLMSPYSFSEDKLLLSRPTYITNNKHDLYRSRVISCHFLFTFSSFLKEIPYDPEIYFGGYCEETTMSARAWTNGYDFFSPYRTYIWHEYTREGRPKHWDDHTVISPTGILSGDRDAIGRDRTRQLFRQEDYGINLGKYDLGTKRTLKEYEKFCGINFKKCSISDYTLEFKEPPNPSKKRKKYEIIYLDLLKKINLKKLQEFKVLAVRIVNNKGESVYKEDINIDKNLNYNLNLQCKVEKDTAFKLRTLGLDFNENWNIIFEELF